MPERALAVWPPTRTVCALAVLIAMLIGACTAGGELQTTDLGSEVLVESSTVATTTPLVVPSAVPTVVPTTIPTPAPTATPEPTATPAPTPTSSATPTPVDTSDPVVVGDSWTVTENDIDRLTKFIEITHELAFRGPVRIIIDDDIGNNYARGFEPFAAEDWALMRSMGIVDDSHDRLAVNQLRLDLVRGVCCEERPEIAVGIEIQPTKLGTELLVVHELTHALHRQHPELLTGRQPEVREFPSQTTSVVEGIAQFMTFRYLAEQSSEAIAEIGPTLPIITTDELALTGAGPGRLLNFAYGTAPVFVDVVFEARGAAGLSELLQAPPVTGEQVLFPDRYLDGQEPVTVSPPPVPPGGSLPLFGRIGSVLLRLAVAGDGGTQAGLDLIDGWAGDAYTLYNANSTLCLAATIAMDSAPQAIALADALREVVPVASEPEAAGIVADGEMISIATC